MLEVYVVDKKIFELNKLEKQQNYFFYVFGMGWRKCNKPYILCV